MKNEEIPVGANHLLSFESFLAKIEIVQSGIRPKTEENH